MIVRLGPSPGLTSRFLQKGFYAVYSAAALVAVQVGMGIVLKSAQTDNHYDFSPSSSVTISEALKMVLAAVMFRRECKARRSLGRAGGYYSSVAESESAEAVTEHELGDAHDQDDQGGQGGQSARKSPYPSWTFWAAVRSEVPFDVAFGLAFLALFYVLINNLIFVSYQAADPATIQLTKSGVTCITALVLIFGLGQHITRVQWLAILFQLCGLVVTQYDAQGGGLYPPTTYLLLVFQVFLSAVAGVVNQALLQVYDSSLHANNVILYGSGAATNLLCHVMIRLVKPDEPGFFQGYGNLQALLIIANNVLIGLAMNAVYKYANAIIKCFATTVATALLILVSPLLFGTSFNLLVVPGSIIIFGASWLYAAQPSIGPAAPTNTTRAAAALPPWLRKRSLYPVLYGIALLLTLVLVAATCLVRFDGRPSSSSSSASAVAFRQRFGPAVAGSTGPVASPLSKTMAFVRWNGPHPERIPQVSKYKPFFHTVHISMPDNEAPDHGADRYNLTHDAATFSYTIYRQVAYTMQLILASQPDIEGLLYFHFDGWVDPLAWDRNLDRAHAPYFEFEGPYSGCWTQREGAGDHWAFNDGLHEKSQAASAAVKAKFPKKYTIKDAEFCLGWADFYYVPRRFFQDYINLALVFANEPFDVFHEIALPTIFHIMDQSLRHHRHVPAVDRITDCWGNCCRANPTVKDVTEFPCGHKLDYLNATVTDAFYAKLDDQASTLAKRP